MRSPVPSKPALTIVTLVALMKVPDALPYFQDYRVLDFATLPKVLDFVPRRSTPAPIEEELLRLHPDRDEKNYGFHRVVAGQGALDHFDAALLRAESGQDAVRIVHYGDSPTTADLITGDARRMLQKRFGDAGHGYVLIGKPWAWYEHAGVSIQSSGWTIEPATTARLADGSYGLGGVSFRGTSGASTRLTLKDPTHSSVEIWFERQPGGGGLAVSADGVGVGGVSTAGPAKGADWQTVELPNGARRLDILALGPVRWYGVSLHKAGAGIVYDSLGLNGAYISVLARVMNEARWAESLRHRNPDLVIINYGTNESVYEGFVDKQVGKELREVVRRVRAALPEASILLMSPMDRGVRQTGGVIGTVPAIPKIAGIQQQVAQETGCAFFNTFLAMGGPGTMGRWYEAEPRLVGADFIHPMPAGARIVGNLLYRALLDDYNRYKVRKMNERLTARTRVTPVRGGAK